MSERNITETIGIVLPTIGIYLLLTGHRAAALIVLFMWYLGFGFVGLAFYFFRHKKYKVSLFFLSITVPNILLPFRRAGYFWLKTWNAYYLGPISNEAMWEGLSKINPKHMGTEDNKARYYMTQAVLCLEMKKFIDAGKHAQIALEHAKDVSLRGTIEELIEKINTIG